jgi:CarD family transcriptional regulator
MYKENDTVMYKAQGLCKITEISEKEFGGNRRLYYVLKPLNDDKATIFVPADNETTTAKMYPVSSPEEILALIQAMSCEKTIWIEDEIARKSRYQEILSGDDRLELARLAKTLYLHQQTQKNKGKRLHLTDERCLREAEKILHEEIAHVLNIERDQVLPFILGQVRLGEEGSAGSRQEKLDAQASSEFF